MIGNEGETAVLCMLEDSESEDEKAEEDISIQRGEKGGEIMTETHLACLVSHIHGLRTYKNEQIAGVIAAQILTIIKNSTIHEWRG